MTVQPTIVPLKDNATTTITTFYEGEIQNKPILLICPAMGVKASYYQPLAEKFAQNGIIAITVDLRGHGTSSVRANRKNNFGYSEMIADYAIIIETIQQQFPQNKKYIVGHSLGGQIGALYLSQNPDKVDGLILIACCSVYYKGWKGLGKWRILMATQMFSGLSSAMGYFPGNKIGFGGREFKTVMKDWAKQARTGKYMPENNDHDYENSLNLLQKPVLAISFEPDNFAPKKAVEHLLGKMIMADKTHHHLIPDKKKGIPKLSHFSWVKKSDRVVEEVVYWLKIRS